MLCRFQIANPKPCTGTRCSPTMTTTSGVGGGEWEVEIDDGFVYKRPRDLYPTDCEDAPSAPVPAPETIRLQRRRRALLRLRAKYILELAHWDSLSSNLLAPPPTSPIAPSGAPSASPCPVIASSHLDDLLSQVDVQEKILDKTSQLCDKIMDICNEQEAAVVDAVAALPVWGSPRHLMNSLCSPNEQAEDAPLPACGNQRQLNAERTVTDTN